MQKIKIIFHHHHPGTFPGASEKYFLYFTTWYGLRGTEFIEHSVIVPVHPFKLPVCTRCHISTSTRF